MIRFRKAAIPPPQEDAPLLLATLLQQRRYDEIYEVLQFHSPLEEWLGLLQTKSLTTPASILHDMIRANSPLHLIDLALAKLAELRCAGECPTLTMDPETGQTALHIAVIQGADLAVIRRLTAHSTLAASSMDSFRRFPLHWACAGVSSATSTGSSSSQGRKGGAQQAIVAVSAETIRYLLELFPEAMTVKDCGGKTPYDLATAHQQQRQHTTALSLFLRPRRGQQKHQAQSVTSTRIQLELTTALWKLLPTYRAIVWKQQGNGTRRHARMRFVV
jgi:hypothetical protein